MQSDPQEEMTGSEAGTGRCHTAGRNKKEAVAAFHDGHRRHRVNDERIVQGAADREQLDAGAQAYAFTFR